MAEYRDELSAARMRIDTLEAKLAERDAALRARDAELVERDAELARLRGASGTSAGRGRSFASHALVGLATLTVGFGAGIMMNFTTRHMEVVSVPFPIEPRIPQPAEPDPGSEVHPAHVEATAGGEDAGRPLSFSAQVELRRPSIEKQIRACFSQERLRNPSATGFLSVTFDIIANGRVSRVELGGTLPSSPPWWSHELATCVDDTVRAQRFLPSGEGKTTAKLSLYLLSYAD
ncbi:hypothetical protein [Polyangium aurulentum]|uniref:hypothetical protein n=1 Tax=Polyangium aurulentum TaxID=2567896 RepID=UPI0010AE8B52|nr:hypothetical protein [Polyangium aurulentum]UQA57729.1 hypothetical protein E8A73_041685 [Polyangium aurulentum]